MGAVTAVIQLLKFGDHVLCGDDMYGGTDRLFKDWSNFGIKLTKTDLSNEQNIKKMILPETKVCV